MRGHRRRRSGLAAGILVAALALLCVRPAAYAFAASTQSTLTASATTVPNGSRITFTYSTPASTVSAKNWIGIYQTGQTPGQVGSTTWQYAPGASGSLTFSTTSLSGVGNWTAYYLYNDGYQQLASVTFKVTPSQPAPPPVYVRAFSGHGDNALSGPYGVALDARGNVWVADTGHDRVVQYTSAGATIASFGQGQGDDPGLSHPEGIAVDGRGNVWVADTGHNRVVEYSSSGKRVAVLGSPGTGNGQLHTPTGVAVDNTGTVWVADYDNNRVQEFSPGGSYVASLSVPTPFGVALDGSGHVWVSSPSYANGNMVFEFSASGTQLTSFGSTHAKYGALSNPTGIAVDSSGLVYVVQPDYGFVTVFHNDGTFSSEFGLQLDPRQAARNLAFPQGVAVGAKGHLWIADSGNDRIVEFAPPTFSPASSGLSWPVTAPFTGACVGVGVGGLAVALVARRRRRAAFPAAAGTA